MKKALFNWSGGKDSALCLHKILQSEKYEISCLLTTISEKYQRISQHGVRVELLEQQVENIGIPLHKLMMPDWPTMEAYNGMMEKTLKEFKEQNINFSVFGFCAAQQQTYYGYKLHGVCTMGGVITDFDLSKANMADIHYLNDIRDQYHDCILLGDKGYLSNELQTELFEKNRLLLKTPMRSNQKQFKKQPAVFRRVRKRIETIFSQLCDQFMIRRNYAKTFIGLATRVLSKITAFTLLQYINKFITNRPLNHVKHALV
ncbi:IS982 family transposase [Caldithrix abyssi]|nr:IS982 family transposase [Caldithrix abyssi]